MKLSAKSRYALASVMKMAIERQCQETMTVLQISTELNISKIYLERVFSELRKGGVISSIKGAQGGYFLSREPKDISVYDILLSVEPALFDDNEKTIEEIAPNIEKTLQNKIYQPLNESIYATIKEISVLELMKDAKKSDTDYMYYL